ncbi:MAG: ABC-F family ATP-binding cassette domain-containing protein [Bacteroidetes bacterium]|nr:ABC-F family ATP-binding cassette domain-containing protein [Bacteroidota bacterium]
MNYLSVESVSKSYGSKVLFDKISFGLNQGQRMALIAKNGAGKSTLLKIITGKEISDGGSVTFRKDITVTYLDQNPLFDANSTVIEAIYNTDNPMLNAVRNYETALTEFEKEYNDKTSEQLELCSAQMDKLEAWDFEAKVHEILQRLKIAFLDKQISTLSGGQKKRVALAKVLIDEPHLLILDEPTNHLDVEMIEWLENYLVSRDLTLLLVTHDRYFLDSVCTEIVEIDAGKLFHYRGNFQYFVEKKAEREMMENSEIDKAKNLYKRELEWVRKMPRARGTKAKYRVDSFYEVKDKAFSKQTEEKLVLGVQMSRIGGKILEFNKIKKAFNETKIINDFSYIFKKGEKIGVIGKNGVGKSTFLNMVMGLETPDSGGISTGETIVFGYYSQEGLKLNEDKRVIDVVKDIAEFIPLADGSKLSASGLLTKFLFPPDVQYGFVSKLSGGERRRLYLMTILITNPNFLILDEPTNDLDIVTLSVLEDFLTSFQGCLLVVTHDRYFMDKMVDHLFVFEGEGVVRDFPGNYTEYREKKEQEEKKIGKDAKASQQQAAAKSVSIDAAPVSYSADTTSKTTTQKKKLSFKEKFEFEELEKEIAKLEAQKAKITEDLNTSTDNHDDIVKWTGQIGNIIAQLDEKSLRWLELSEGV